MFANRGEARITAWMMYHWWTRIGRPGTFRPGYSGRTDIRSLS